MNNLTQSILASLLYDEPEHAMSMSTGTGSEVVPMIYGSGCPE